MSDEDRGNKTPSKLLLHPTSNVMHMALLMMQQLSSHHTQYADTYPAHASHGMPCMHADDPVKEQIAQVRGTPLLQGALPVYTGVFAKGAVQSRRAAMHTPRCT